MGEDENILGRDGLELVVAVDAQVESLGLLIPRHTLGALAVEGDVLVKPVEHHALACEEEERR